MKDLFDTHISPMLIAENAAPFADKEYVYEIKWDGERCVAFLDPDNGVRQKRKLSFPGNSFRFLASVIPTQKIFRIVFQTVKGIDTAGPRLDLLPGIIRERVEVAFCLRLTVEQGVQVGIVHLSSPRR